ncbi:MAG: Rrf2 family transcriptional regulator [Flavobacteriales bacterium]|nr:Rrf2 family transcriptional regulator [Flavobacteriales bacterium]
MFSKTSEYAFRATVVVAIASKNGERLTLTDIAERTGAPKAFTAKVLQELARAGIVTSHRGPNGGFDLPPLKARKVNLRMVMEAVGDDTFRQECAMGLGACNSDNPCPMHDQFSKVRDELNNILETTHIHSLTLDLDEVKTRLKI